MSSKDSLIVLDELDKRILQQLQQDASLTNHELAARVHASPPTCLRRVKRLTEEKVIARQVAIITPEKVGASLTAIVEITLDHQATEKQLEFEALVASESAVQQCYRVSPGPDFVLVILVADMAAYHALAHRLFATQANVRNVRSFFSILRSKFETRVPVE
ncbi:Lrp/AsnC family transcriptional regulator [Undibacterium sp.]|jgi:Lrp/AsnC family leucine-responsive transcriptional regulator|uniref:Lrp/AsnC family transcriptional regulator n=1 Tax=Undibacterium sp. TaxID=1914977 RepID=UPI002B87EC96|nr:Lrp/AsnC family transcriptional regulator [Undibacterium sp.]HTD02742.1 Lrp/AsnC family transcriptional regulator [Undibacterium sp.]